MCSDGLLVIHLPSLTLAEDVAYWLTFKLCHFLSPWMPSRRKVSRVYDSNKGKNQPLCISAAGKPYFLPTVSNNTAKLEMSMIEAETATVKIRGTGWYWEFGMTYLLIYRSLYRWPKLCCKIEGVVIWVKQDMKRRSFREGESKVRWCERQSKIRDAKWHRNFHTRNVSWLLIPFFNLAMNV